MLVHSSPDSSKLSEAEITTEIMEYNELFFNNDNICLYEHFQSYSYSVLEYYCESLYLHFSDLVDEFRKFKVAKGRVQNKLEMIKRCHNVILKRKMVKEETKPKNKILQKFCSMFNYFKRN